MTIKLTALLTSACAVCLYVLSLIIPNDPYFFFISPNFSVALARIGLAFGMLILSTRQRFRYKATSTTLYSAAALLVSFGVGGLVVPSFDYSLYSIFKPFDYLYFVGVGFYFGYFGMTIAPGRRKLHLPRLAHSASLRLARWSGA